jgi:hypothetical protein
MKELLPEEHASLVFVSIERIVEEANGAVDLEAELRSATDGQLGIEALTGLKALGVAGWTGEHGPTTRLVLLIDE